MKRLYEELFFKYKGHPYQENTNSISFDLPEDYDPLPGDIIEMIISENTNVGFLGYYAKMVCCSAANKESSEIDIAALDGFLLSPDGNSIALFGSWYTVKENHKKFVSLEAGPNIAVSFDNNANYLVNMIVHRSKGDVGLYFI